VKKEMLKKEIQEKFTQVNAIIGNKNELRIELGKLGIFAGNQKKIIDEKFNSFEKEIITINKEIAMLQGRDEGQNTLQGLWKRHPG
jgi:hypothetical protein